MDQSISEHDQRILNEIASRAGAPSFIRRARLVETSWSNLLDRLALVRLKHLEFVSLRLGQLLALAGVWEALRPYLPFEEDRVRLERLHDELQPRLRMPLEATTSGRQLRAALRELRAAMEAFNQRWSKLLAQTDLKAVNDARDAYNRNYLLEKECAFGSATVARKDFERLDPVATEQLFKEFPLLPLPHVV